MKSHVTFDSNAGSEALYVDNVYYDELSGLDTDDDNDQRLDDTTTAHSMTNRTITMRTGLR